jgi:Fur family transcriptional regulator, peroxide stress response regulator
LVFSESKNRLVESGLKVTPQRIAVLDALMKLDNHPTADKIIEYVRKSHPHIAVGTVYKVLETLSDKKIIRKVKTDRDVMKYDAVPDSHHHLYCSESDKIRDYFDDKLDGIIKDYFRKKKIPGFKIEDIKLQINGKFIN